MNDLKVNKIIAEFMFKRDIDFVVSDYKSREDVISRYYSYFTKYLDSLIPVWEKLRLVPEFEKNNKGWDAKIITTTMAKFSYGETIQQAAAYATAKAILELNGK